MLTLIVGGDDYWNEETEQFETHGHVEVVMEHSLASQQAFCADSHLQRQAAEAQEDEQG
jgi:hypothetical protein